MYRFLTFTDFSGRKYVCGVERRHGVSGISLHWDTEVGCSYVWAVLELRTVQLAKTCREELMETVISGLARLFTCSGQEDCSPNLGFNHIIQDWQKAWTSGSPQERVTWKSKNNKESLECYLACVPGCQCRGHSASARWSSRADDTLQNCCLARSPKDFISLWISGQDLGDHCRG